MPLEKKNIAFPFLKGIETKEGPKAQAVGGMSEARNVSCTRTGDFESRRGFLQEGDTIPEISGVQGAGDISSTASVSSSTQLIKTEDETVILDGVESFTKGADDVWIRRGTLKACEFETEDIETVPISTCSKASVATVNGYDVSVWVEQPYDVDNSPDNASLLFNSESDNFALNPPAMYYKVRSRETNAVIVPKTKLEDMVTELRCAGYWLVDGIEASSFPDGRVGPVTMNPPSSPTPVLHDLQNEAVVGNLATLRVEDSTSLPHYGMEETRPIQTPGSYPFLSYANIQGGAGAKITYHPFSGPGLNDFVLTGTYTGSDLKNVWVRIDPYYSSYFNVSYDSGASWSGSYLVTSSPQVIGDGLSVNWFSPSGHTPGDYWSFIAAPLSANFPTSWIYTKADVINSQNSKLFINHTKGANTNYYQMKPQLFAYPALGVMVLIYANGVNPAGSNSNSRGRWKLFYRTINLRPGAGATGAAKFIFGDATEFPALAANATLASGNTGLFMNRLAPSWDADYCFDPTDSPDGGFAVVHQTPRVQSHFNPNYDRQVFFTSYSVSATDTTITVSSQIREENLSLLYTGVQIDPMERAFMKSRASSLTSIETWMTNPSAYADFNPAITLFTLKGINKWDQTSNQLVADSSNTMYLFYDCSERTYNEVSLSLSQVFEPQPIIMKLTTQGGGTSPSGYYDHVPFFEQIPNPGSPTEPKTYEDFPVLTVSDKTYPGVSIVDVAVAQPMAPDDKIYVLIQVCNPVSGVRDSTRGAHVAGPDSWIIRKELAEAFSDPYSGSSPEILFRNVDIVSDGIIDSGTPRRSYFCVSYSGFPTSSGYPDVLGRTCITDWNGTIVSAWRPSEYSTTSDSQVFSVSEQEKLQNNTCLRGLRSRLMLDPSVPKGNMEFGLNEYHSDIKSKQYKWMVPTKGNWNASPASPLQNTIHEGSLYVASGLLWKYAGSKFTENEFLTGPLVFFTGVEDSKHGSVAFSVDGTGKAVETLTPKGGLQKGHYVYYFNYFWRDVNGDSHTSISTSLSPFGSNEETEGSLSTDHKAPSFRVSGLQITNHRDIPNFIEASSGGRVIPTNGHPIDAVIQVWRTPVNEVDGEPGLVQVVSMEDNKREYLITDDPPQMEGPLPGASLALNQPEVSGSDVLNTFVSNMTGYRGQPGSPVSVARHMDHLILTTTANDVWSSLPLVEGFAASFELMANTEGPTNANIFTPSRDERITHVASTGNSFFCFTANNVYQYTGAGTFSPGQGGYQGPSNVGPGMGIRPDGIAKRIPGGVVYQSQKGFYLLSPRGGKPAYFSGSVQAYDKEKPVGVAVSDSMQTIAICLGGSSKTILLYNWEFKMWTTWHFEASTVGDLAGMSNYVTQEGQDTLTLMSKNGHLWNYKTDAVTTTDRFCDEKVGVKDKVIPEVTTGWIQFPQFHRSFRVYRSNVLFRFAPLSKDSTFTISVYSNFNESVPSSVHTLTVDSASDVEPCEVVVKPTQQKGNAFKLKINLSGGVDNDSEMVILSGLAFLVGDRKPGQAYEPLDPDYESAVS